MGSAGDARPGGGYAAPVAPVRRPSGPPVPRSGWMVFGLAVIAAVSFLAGVQVAGTPRMPAVPTGAPAPTPVGTPPPLSVTASPSVPARSVQNSPAVALLASGVSLQRALATARTAFLGPAPLIMGSRVEHYRDVSRAGLASPDAWVWVFTAWGTFTFASCGGATASPAPCASPATTARVIVDVETGAFIEADVPGTP